MSGYIKKPFKEKNGFFSLTIRDNEVKKVTDFYKIIHFLVTKKTITNIQSLMQSGKTDLNPHMSSGTAG